MDDETERQQEIEALEAIYGDDFSRKGEDSFEITVTLEDESVDAKKLGSWAKVLVVVNGLALRSLVNLSFDTVDAVLGGVQLLCWNQWHVLWMKLIGAVSCTGI